MCSTPNYFLLSADFGLRWRIFDELHLELETGFAKGFKKIAIYDIEYYMNDILENTYSTYALGDYFKIELGLSYSLTKTLKGVREVFLWLDPSLGEEGE